MSAPIPWCNKCGHQHEWPTNTCNYMNVVYPTPRLSWWRRLVKKLKAAR